MASSPPRTPDQEPLLERARSPNGSSSSYSTILKDDEENPPNNVQLDRSVENDVLPETAVLGRNLGWSSAYILIISRVIGSGIFATPGAIVRSVGSVGITLILWIVGALLSWIGLAVSLEYGTMLPRSGGDKVYLEFTYRHPRFLATVLIGVQSVLLGFTASNCIVFGEYVFFALDRDASKFEQKLLALGLLTAIIIVHSCFLKTGIFIQNVLGWIKIALVIFMIFTSLFVVLFRPNEATNEASMTSHPIKINRDFLWEGSVWNWGIISTALFKVFYSYAGLQNVNNVLNEVKNPVKTLKSAASTALLTACILYLFINIAYFLVVPIEDIKDSGELIAALFFERVFGAQVGKVMLPLAVAISAAGNVMVVSFSHARVIQEIARQGFLPFSRVISSSKPFHAPMGALITHYIPSFLVICIPAENIYSFILDVEGYPAQYFGLASTLGLIWLRFKRPDLHRPYKAFLPALWLRIALSIALLVAPFVPRKGVGLIEHLGQVSYAIVGTSIILFGILYWYIVTVLIPRWKGYQLEEAVEVLDDGTKTVNYQHPTIQVDTTIHDISGDEDKYTLDSHGFQIYKRESKEKDFVDNAKIKAEYYPETEQLLKDATGASRIFIFDHTIRRQAVDKRDPEGKLRGPGKRVHIDQSYSASEGRVRYHLPDEADELLKKRFQIVNVWRPIKTIYKDPLGVADALSCPDSDLVAAALIYADRAGETYTVKPNPGHRWYFKYAQRPDEVMLIKCYDSLDDGRARRIPHSAFTNPAEEDKDPRESIEARALVFYDY
ncbi:hypothetical protein NA57DRAFT_69814 [Rhizodiscina lignyota]|uniref:Methionine permease n=1 Tax=Rhizodiscina lignyota TaxID=1504668 RepID=A0A9P4LZA0_9PEZI|nr:hypothetical protein NA57DRAFT_69814 [Rhizodiscina lignyota]